MNRYCATILCVALLVLLVTSAAWATNAPAYTCIQLTGTVAGADKRLREVGQFNIRGGLGFEAFVRGVNTLDIDVDDVVGANAPPVLQIRPEVSGIWAPRREGPAQSPPNAADVGRGAPRGK